MLSDTVEYLRSSEDPAIIVGDDHTRQLGILIARGPTVLSICKEEGFEMAVENPYAQIGAEEV